MKLVRDLIVVVCAVVTAVCVAVIAYRIESGGYIAYTITAPAGNRALGPGANLSISHVFRRRDAPKSLDEFLETLPEAPADQLPK